MRRLRVLEIAVAGLALCLASRNEAQTTGSAQADTPISQVSPADAARRADALIRRMTVQEKAGQLSQLFAISFLPPVDADVRAGTAGALLFVTNPAETNRLQRIAVTETRLKIPLLFGFDVIHGLRTIFPVPLGMTASFDPRLAEQAQGIAASEARAVGIHWTFAPMVDIARDPRWGRIVEGAGEDPYLASVMADAQVRGFQGAAIGAPGHLIAGPKHFLGYGAAPGGRDYDGVQLSETEIRNVYLPPFAAAVKAGAGNVMSAYMDLNDVPASANGWLLGDLLRGELGFDGWVVSDANGIKNQVPQHFATGEADAAVRGLLAGNDMEMSIGKPAFAAIPAAVAQGRLPMKVLDRAVRRVLVAKIRMGLFERPFVDETEAARILATPSHRDAAQVAAERSLVLLRNEGSSLPLTPGAHKRVAVIGPMADSAADTLGPWVFAHDLRETVTLFAGVRDRLGFSARVETAPGVQLVRRIPSGFEAFTSGKVEPWPAQRRAAEFDRAVEAMTRADLVILALGEAASQSGERASASTLTLPGDQRRLFDAAVATGKPIVLVLMNGRPLDLTGMVERVPAILEAWYPGTRGGTAIARALFGDVNPGGKLPVTWPRSVGQVPIYYAQNRTHTPERQAQRYHDAPSTPLYPFGHGLSYTSFTISPPELDRPALTAGGAVTVSVVVTNTGQRAGDEVVQIYTHQRAGRGARPARELKGFQRVQLTPGERKRLSFVLDDERLAYWSAQAKAQVVDPGEFDIWVGSSSDAAAHTILTVGGLPRFVGGTARQRPHRAFAF